MTVVLLLSCTTGGGGGGWTVVEEDDRSTVFSRTTLGPHAMTLVVKAKIVTTRIFFMILLLIPAITIDVLSVVSMFSA